MHTPLFPHPPLPGGETDRAAPVIAVGADSAMDASLPWLAVKASTALAGDGALPVQFVDEALRRQARQQTEARGGARDGAARALFL